MIAASRKRVIRTGRGADADRDALLSGAAAMVFPSEYEGFGAPLVEAMTLGTPIVSSAQPAVREVVGDAGRLGRRRRRWRGVGGGRCPALAAASELVAAGRRARRSSRLEASGSALAAPTVRRRGRSADEARIVLCPHFEPDTAPTGVVMTPHRRRAGGRGHELHVVTSLALVPRPSHRAGMEWPVDATRGARRGARSPASTRSPAADKSNLARRAVGFAGFSALAGLAGVAAGGLLRRADAVLAMSPPLTLGLTGWAGRRWSVGAPLVFNIQDIFPDAAVRTGAIRNRRVIALAAWLERLTYRRPTRSRCCQRRPAAQRRAPSCRRGAARHGARHPQLRRHRRDPPGRPHDARTAPSSESATSRWCSMPATSGSRSRSICCSKRPAGCPNVTFLINGDGAAGAELRARCGRSAQRPLRRLPAGDRLAELLATGDVHVVPLRAAWRRQRAVEDLLDPRRRPPGRGLDRPRHRDPAPARRRRRRRRRRARRPGRVRRPPSPPSSTTRQRRATMGAAGRDWVERGRRRRQRSGAAYDQLLRDARRASRRRLMPRSPR